MAKSGRSQSQIFTTKDINVVKRSNIQKISFSDGHFFRLNCHII